MSDDELVADFRRDPERGALRPWLFGIATGPPPKTPTKNARSNEASHSADVIGRRPSCGMLCPGDGSRLDQTGSNRLRG